MQLKKSAINLREELDANRPTSAGPPYVQLNLGTGDGTLKIFALPKGWSPLNVFKAGLLQTGGSGNDFMVNYDGFIYSVVFAVAPANGNVILTDAWRP